MTEDNDNSSLSFYDRLRAYIEDLERQSMDINESHRSSLDSLSEYIKQKLRDKEDCNLIFICTHNSRRSIFAQIWMQTAALHYGVSRIKTFSGGTEATEANIRAIHTLERAGFIINLAGKNDVNPQYIVDPGIDAGKTLLFSKVYDSESNPQKDFAAIMVCSDANEACPVVFGADKRIPLPYKDPKHADGTDKESEAYDNASILIAKEMFYVMKKVRDSEF